MEYTGERVIPKLCHSQNGMLYTEQELLEVLNPFSEITMYNQVDRTIEIPEPDKKHYLMVAICKK